jgi:hypothetical protein
METTQAPTTTFSAFRGHAQIASGSIIDVAMAIRALHEQGDATLILIFDDLNGRQIEFDFSGSMDDVARRYGGVSTGTTDNPTLRRKPGRPKLGVVGREITLLPRHWAWLETQRGGPSATLRRLVDQARAASGDRDRIREAQDAINRFISATAGNLSGFEEATRALYRGDRQRFDVECARWPTDIRHYVEHWAVAAFGILSDPVS